MPLTDMQIRRAEPRAKPYKMFDGAGLFLLVTPTAKLWRFRYRFDGKEKLAALGAYPDVALAGSKCKLTQKWIDGARDKRDQMRKLLASGIDPVAARREVEETKRAKKLEQALTVEKLCEEWIDASKPHWQPEHLAQIEQSLEDHVYRAIGDRPAHAIRPGDIGKLLADMLHPEYDVPRKRRARAAGMVETARRVRQRLDAAYRYGMLHYDRLLLTNPVAGAATAINKSLKAARENSPKTNFPCVEPKEFPALLRAMRAYKGSLVTRSLLWFVTLTACRTGEARHAVWSEIDFDEAVWTIPPEKMKRGFRHRIPLSPAAIAILEELHDGKGESEFVFPHPRKKERVASENALLYVFAEIGYKGRMTGHGLRSIFSMIANKARTKDGTKRWDSDLIEAALAHGEEDAVKAAYQRDDYFDERRPLMEWWANEIERLEKLEALKAVPKAA